MTRSKIKEEKVAGQYQHLGDPSKKVVLRAGGVMHSSEDGKPRENEEGTWSVKSGEVHISVDGHNFIFEIKDNGNLQVVALLGNSVREDVSERIKKAFILKRIIADSGKPKATPSQMVQGRWLLCFIVLVLASLIYQSCWPVRETASKSVVIADPIVEIADPIVEIADPIVEKTVRRLIKKPVGRLTEADLEKVTKSFLGRTDITDAGLKDVAKLQQLEGLWLTGTKITNAGLKDVAKLQKLTRLGLRETEITDAGLLEVAKLQKLEQLNLISTKITDEGLIKVAKLQKLKTLFLASTQITDEGLVMVAKLQNLRSLGLNNTKVTAVGVADLQKALPNCRIIGP